MTLGDENMSKYIDYTIVKPRGVDDDLITRVIKGCLAATGTQHDRIIIGEQNITLTLCSQIRNFNAWSDFLSNKLAIIAGNNQRHIFERVDFLSYQHWLGTVELGMIITLVGQSLCLSIVDGDQVTFDALGDLLNTVKRDAHVENNYFNVDRLIGSYLIGPIYKYLQQRDANVGVKYGDVIRFDCMPSNDEGCYICLHHSAIPLTYDSCNSCKPNPHGNVPKEFAAITDFPIQYFSEAISSNRHVWLPKSLRFVDSWLHSKEEGVGRTIYAIEQDKYFNVDTQKSDVGVEVFVVNSSSSQYHSIRVYTYAHNEIIRAYIAIIYNSDNKQAVNYVIEKLLTEGHYGAWVHNVDNIVVIDARNLTIGVTTSDNMLQFYL